MTSSSSLCLNLVLQAAHALYKRYEPRATLIHVHVLLLVGLPSYVSTAFGPYFTASPWLGIVLAFMIYYTMLISSIFIYRLSPWHPLANYPGPVLARISKLWGVIYMAKSKTHQKLKSLHEKYGPYVRVGKRLIFKALPLGNLICFTLKQVRTRSQSLMWKYSRLC